MDESHKHNIGGTKPDAKEYMGYNFIYIKAKSLQNSSMLKVVVISAA